jgi:polysaccharide export outer membrane protein
MTSQPRFSGILGRHRQVWRAAVVVVVLLIAGVAWLTGAPSSPSSVRATKPAPAAAESANSVEVVRPAGSAFSGERGSILIPEYPEAVQLGRFDSVDEVEHVRLCQAFSPASPYRIDGIDSAICGGCGEPGWRCMHPLPFQEFAQGEYIDPYRTPHVVKYRLRVDDLLDLVYRLTMRETSRPYELNVGDVIRVESLTDKNLDRERLLIQPDGMISLRLLGQCRAAGKTIDELRGQLEERYTKYYKVPAMSVTPLEVNAKLNEVRAMVDSRAGVGGQGIRVRVSPDGTVQVPALASVPAQGLTLEELKAEIDLRYAQEIQGVEVTPILSERASRFAYVLGEVQTPGRYELQGPTTVSQSIALAGGWNNGGNLRHVVVFRRAADWRLLATRLDLNGALLGVRPCPSDEIWVRDSDIVLVPKSAILVTADFIDLVFRRCLYGVLPFQGISIGMSSI